MANVSYQNDFPSVIRYWRSVRKLSQLDLALAADVSQRHVSWLETGRSQPSRDMVIRLAEAMNLSLRDRNTMLQHAGFAHLYSEQSLSAPAMEPFKEVLNNMLAHHLPYPAMVLDRHWHVLMQNSAAEQLLASLFNDNELAEFSNEDGNLSLPLLSLHPNGLRRFIVNWSSAGPLFYQRLKKETLATADSAFNEMINQVAGYVDDLSANESPSVNPETMTPVLPLQLRVDGRQLDVCSVISTFGTAQDVTSSEVKIETFYPNNTATRQFFHQADHSQNG